MAENKMKEVAKLLGVEFGKPFKIKDCRMIYTLKEDGLYNEYGGLCSCTLKSILTGELEIEQPILTQKEKKYLEGVLRPFKDRVECVVKTDLCKKECISILIKNDSSLPFPLFEKDTMYKGMELDKAYTLEELGLFEEE